MIDLFTAATPNGWKVSIAFEELELPYNPIVLNLSERKQHEEWFYQMNPNGRIPVIVDHDVEDLTIFETGAIMLYLAEKSGKFMPSDFKRRHAAMQWLMFQMSGIGPMQGQAVAFERYFPEDVPAARKRYHNETRRLYEVLDRHLADHEWLADEYTIAAMANWAWIRSHKWERVPPDGSSTWVPTWSKRAAADPNGSGNKSKWCSDNNGVVVVMRSVRLANISKERMKHGF